MSHEAENHKAEIGGLNPEEQIQCREYKLLLKPERFADEDGFHKFYKHIHQVAQGMGVNLEKSGKHEPHVREVVFYDTPHSQLYTDGFILRKRTFFKKGYPEPNFELTIRYRHPDAKVAAAVDMHPLLPASTPSSSRRRCLRPPFSAGPLPFPAPGDTRRASRWVFRVSR